MSYKTMRFYMPWYWPLWLLVFIFFLLSLLPYRLQMTLGKFLGRFIKCVSKNSRNVASINLKLCYPDESEAFRQQLLQKSFENIGEAVFETALSIWGSNRRLEKLLQHTGDYQHISEAIEKKQGIIILGAHFTTIEIAGRLGALRIPYSVVYRPSKIAFLNFLLEKVMRRHYQKALPNHSIRDVVKYLKQGGIVWYSADVSTKRNKSVFAPFFGIETATAKAVFRYAEMSSAKVACIKHFRRDDGNGYDFEVTPFFENFPSTDGVADATRVNQFIEAAVREKPEQYLWQYKRFKTRPKGEKKFYP